MQAFLALEGADRYALKHALLVYESRSRSHGATSCFMTRHEVAVDENQRPALGPVELLSADFLQNLLQQLEDRAPVEILPASVLACRQDRLCWWTPSSTRTMFYHSKNRPEMEELSGKRYIQPALVFLLSRGSLSIRALADDERPTADTPLFRAPYWNVSDNGAVCLGSTKVPRSARVADIDRWAASFLESEFTHPNGAQRLTTHPGGFIAMWRELENASSFPAGHLAASGETLSSFIGE